MKHAYIYEIICFSIRIYSATFLSRVSSVGFIVVFIVAFMNATMNTTMNSTNNDKEFKKKFVSPRLLLPLMCLA